MTAREDLQAAYELAFYPPRLHEVWALVKQDHLEQTKALARCVDMALQLHAALPENGYASHRALKRLAVYQANARAFGTVACLRKLRQYLGAQEPLDVKTVPGAMVRDIGLPPFTHHPKQADRQQP